MTDHGACIILAGGQGTRIREVIPNLPKCLAPVAGRSFLEIQLELIASRGVRRFVLALGHMADKVLDAVEPLRSRYRIECVVEEQPLGTGGALLHVMDAVGLDEVLTVNGDTFLDAALDGMFAPLRTSDGEFLRLAVVRVPHRARYGGIEIDGNRVTGFIEKGACGPGLINAGFYRLHRNAFNGFVHGTVLSLEAQVMPKLVPRGALTATEADGTFIDIGVPQDYNAFCERYA